MTKMRVRSGCTLLYPDGSLRGMGGYVVDTDAEGEAATLDGQSTSLEACADFFSADPVDIFKVTAPKKAEKKKASKKKKTTRRG